MKPGATTSPVASMVRVARSSAGRGGLLLRGTDSERGRIRSRSPMTATSAANPGAPLPSTTVPPWMSMSKDSLTRQPVPMCTPGEQPGACDDGDGRLCTPNGQIRPQHRPRARVCAGRVQIRLACRGRGPLKGLLMASRAPVCPLGEQPMVAPIHPRCIWCIAPGECGCIREDEDVGPMATRERPIDIGHRRSRRTLSGLAMSSGWPALRPDSARRR